MKTTSWRTAWEESDLPPRHRRVLAALTISMGNDGGSDYKCFPGAVLLGRRSGYSERTVRETLQELDGGWITIHERPGKTPLYLAREPGFDWALDTRSHHGEAPSPPWADPGPGGPDYPGPGGAVTPGLGARRDTESQGDSSSAPQGASETCQWDGCSRAGTVKNFGGRFCQEHAEAKWHEERAGHARTGSS